ncbi:MAG: phosphatase PAP2 family protein [Tenacibaculum sp.]
MIDQLLYLDRELLIFLNNLGNQATDTFWLFITQQLTWTPLFIFLLYLVFKQFGLKRGMLTLLFIIILVAFSDQFTNLVKNFTQRLRPCNTPELQQYLRQFAYKPQGFSFWSGHASLSTTFSFYMFLLLKSRFTYIKLLFLFPLFFGLSRIFLGVHYPLDVFFGYLSGLILGYTFYRLYKKLYKSVFQQVLI